MYLTQQEQDAIREARRQYHAEWRRKNPDKIKAANDRYWLKKAKEYERSISHGLSDRNSETQG